MDWTPSARHVLPALDAPLGWLALLVKTLVDHLAGELIEGTPNQLFRRSTDRFIKQVIEKQPLDVGADRTAHAALNLLAANQL